MTVPQLLDEVHDAISRAAEARGDPPRFRRALQRLHGAGSSDPRAELAAVLFELELAKAGEARARRELPGLADELLKLWRAGDAEQLAACHPALEGPWDFARSLLLDFERQRFEHALRDCWDARQDPPALARAIGGLLPEGARRAEFARCLYHLELARQGQDASRVEFARRAGLLAEAYQDPAVARELVESDPGLAFLWQELVPYLDEFFESLEEAAEARATPVPVAEAPSGPTVLPEPRTDPGSPPALGADRPVPSFRTLISSQGTPVPAPPPPEAALAVAPAEEPAPPVEALPPVEPALAAEVAPEAEVAPPPAPQPPAPPRDTLDEDGEVILVGEELAEAASPEPEVVEGVEEETPPPPPPMGFPTPAPEPDPAVNAFWLHTFSRLELLPGEMGRSVRMLSCETRADRKRLSEFVDSLAPHLQVPEARALACLLSLMLAGQTKEKNLFGQPNPRRADALLAALPYLSPDPAAATRVAVWFELDGPQTQEALGQGLELLAGYLGYCARQRRDPLDHAAVQAFVSS